VHLYGIVKPKKEGKIFEIEDMVEKPTAEEAPSQLSILGRYILSPKAMEYLEKVTPSKRGEIELVDALLMLVKEGELLGVITDGDDYDCGDKLGFLKTTVALGLKNKEVGEEFKEYLNRLSK
jgi:UTP--glucose-1-phosphate uridylyltransferase